MALTYYFRGQDAGFYEGAGIASFGIVGALFLYKGYHWLTSSKPKVLSYFRYHSAGPSFWNRVVSLAKAPIRYSSIFAVNENIEKAALHTIEAIQAWIKIKEVQALMQDKAHLKNHLILQIPAEKFFSRAMMLDVQYHTNFEYAEINSDDFDNENFTAKIDEICDYAQQSVRNGFILYIDGASSHILKTRAFKRLLVRMEALNNKLVIVLGVIKPFDLVFE